MVDIPCFANFKGSLYLVSPDCRGSRLFSLPVVRTFSSQEGYFYCCSACVCLLAVDENTRIPAFISFSSEMCM